MNQFFEKGFKLETKSLRSLNEAYYESDETLKPLKNQKALLTVKTALASIRQDYLVYQLFTKKKQLLITAISSKVSSIPLKAIWTIVTLS